MPDAHLCDKRQSVSVHGIPRHFQCSTFKDRRRRYVIRMSWGKDFTRHSILQQHRKEKTFWQASAHKSAAVWHQCSGKNTTSVHRESTPQPTALQSHWGGGEPSPAASLASPADLALPQLGRTHAIPGSSKLFALSCSCSHAVSTTEAAVSKVKDARRLP